MPQFSSSRAGPLSSRTPRNGICSHFQDTSQLYMHQMRGRVYRGNASRRHSSGLVDQKQATVGVGPGSKKVSGRGDPCTLILPFVGSGLNDVGANGRSMAGRCGGPTSETRHVYGNGSSSARSHAGARANGPRNGGQDPYGDAGGRGMD